MTDQDALFAAIVAHPDDDTPRLVYADWLDEHSQPERAEFIRMQIERQRLGAGHERQVELFRREQVLLARHRQVWQREAPNRPFGATYRFRRGFFEIMEVDAQRLEPLTGQYNFGGLIREVIARDCDHLLLTLNRRAREHRVRLRARLMNYQRDQSVLLDLLPEAPPRLESFLTSDRWVILCWAIWSAPDREVAHRLARLHRARGLPIQVGLRPFDDPVEFQTWCPLLLRYQSPIWLILQDGRLITESPGPEPPEELREGWEEV